jgi:C1A family cysteine protease
MLQNFANNDDLIEQHNAQKLSYTLGHNQFSGMSYEEWLAFTRLGLGKPDHRPADNVHMAPADVSTLATSVDWTTKGAVTPVKNQGSCGSCWSFSATGAMEGSYCIKTGTDCSKWTGFSEQELVDCDTGGGDMGCKGGLMDNAFTWVESNNGLCSESAYPYTSGTTEQRGTCTKSSCTNVASSDVKSYTDVQKNSDDALMSALNLQPVSVAIQANQPAFQLYQSGVLTGSCGTNLDHGVLAVGYGTWTDGTDYYQVKNSWGASWGMNGYILIERGADQYGGECGILLGPPSYPTTGA